MEEFVVEHGSILLSGIVAVSVVMLLFIVTWVLSNLDLVAYGEIIG